MPTEKSENRNVKNRNYVFINIWYKHVFKPEEKVPKSILSLK